MWVGMCSLPSCLKPHEGLQTIPPEETLFIPQVYMRQSLEAISTVCCSCFHLTAT